MNYAVVLFFDEAPCGYEVSDNGDQVRFRPAPHRYGPPRPMPEIVAQRAGDGWVLDGTEDPSVRIQVGRLLGARPAHSTIPSRVAP